MGEVKEESKAKKTELDGILNDVAKMIVKKERDLLKEKGLEQSNIDKLVLLKTALDHLKLAKDRFEQYEKC